MAFFEPNQTQTFQCTRHATSCNNIKMGKFLGLDSEPALSVYGIREARMLALEEKRIGSNRFSAPPGIPIAVSALIRTWETTVLLYGFQLHAQAPNQGYTTLSLRICPWLRETSEYGRWFDRGNEPKPLIDSIPKFIKFLNKLIADHSQDYKINTIDIYIPLKNATNNSSNNASLGLRENDWQLIQIHFDESTMTYKLPINLCDINDTIHKVDVYQTEVGDIMKFMTWYTAVFPYNPLTVHIVAHSQIMQKFIKEHIDPKFKNNVTEQNCWSITINYHTKYNPDEKMEILGSIQNGFNKPKDEALNQAKQTEIDQREMSLCGEAGSLGEDKIICPKKKGGRRTRRKRSYRKKTRRYRR